MCAIGRSLSNARRIPRWINSSGYFFGLAMSSRASPLARTSSWLQSLRRTRDGSSSSSEPLEPDGIPTDEQRQQAHDLLQDLDGSVEWPTYTEAASRQAAFVLFEHAGWV